MLRLLADPATSPRVSRPHRCPPRAGARRARIAPAEWAARIARCDSSRAPGPSTDDPRERRSELLELGRLAMAYAMREALAR